MRRSSVSVRDPIWLTLMRMELATPRSMPFFKYSALVTNRSSPTSWMRSPSFSVIPFQPFQKATLREVCSALELQSRKADPAGRGARIVYAFPTNWDVHAISTISTTSACAPDSLGELLDLYDASANHAIVECIARNTPILVNPLESVVEYLGEDYPLYFNSLDEAAWKAENIDLVLSAHEYLVHYPKKFMFTGDYFRESIVQSPIYQSL